MEVLVVLNIFLRSWRHPSLQTYLDNLDIRFFESLPGVDGSRGQHPEGQLFEKDPFAAVFKEISREEPERDLQEICPRQGLVLSQSGLEGPHGSPELVLDVKNWARTRFRAPFGRHRGTFEVHSGLTIYPSFQKVSVLELHLHLFSYFSTFEPLLTQFWWADLT